MAANYYSQEYTLPSTGPLRFAIPYVLLAIVAVRDRNKPRAPITGYALIGLAALWSFETFIYTLTTYLCVEGYALLRSSHGLRHKLRHLVPLFGTPCITIAFCHLALALFTYLRAGVWPAWDHYFDYIFLYSTKGFGQLPIEAWYPWALYVAVYFLSLQGALRLFQRCRPLPLYRRSHRFRYSTIHLLPRSIPSQQPLPYLYPVDLSRHVLAGLYTTRHPTGAASFRALGHILFFRCSVLIVDFCR